MEGITILKKTNLNENELNNAFEIIKLNMNDLGVKISNNDKEFWAKSIKDYLNGKDFYFYLVYLNKKIVGFIELLKSNGIFVVCEIQLANEVKRSKIILKIIKFLFECEELKHVNEVQFSILKNNVMSNKTFSHLGGKIILETENKFRYSLLKSKALDYLSKLKM